MRFGIRAQILLAIAALLVLAFAPLFFAIASLARASMSQAWERDARSLGRAIAGHVNEARHARPGNELSELIQAQLGEVVEAIVLYDRRGEMIDEAGAEEVRKLLPKSVAADREQVIEVTTSRGTALLVLIPGAEGPVGALLGTSASTARLTPLLRLVGLYTGLLGLALLVFAYFALTRIVVTPIDKLSEAARRVAAGDRELRVPRTGGRELLELGASMATMTATMRAEEQLLRDKVAQIEASAADLRRAQDTVVRSERLASVGRLAAGLAHEIGNPIAAILSIQELLLDGELGDDERDFVERMKRETERVHRVLRDLLDFARPAARTPDGEEEEAIASVGDAVEQVAALVRPQKSFAEVSLLVAIEEGLPAVAMHAERVEQVLLNLLLNAADAVPRPGGQVSVSASQHQQMVRVAIEDNGGGIAPSVRGRLFEPFVTTKEVGKGTGLGLAVCRGLIEAAGGTIDVEDGSEGARFVLQLPVFG